MKTIPTRIWLSAAAAWMVAAPAAVAQKRPHIGYVYPAGGRQGEVFQIKLGGQDLDHVTGVQVTGAGVSAKVVEYFRRLGNQEMQLIGEQLKVMKRPAKGPSMEAMTQADPPMMMESGAEGKPAPVNHKTSVGAMVERLERRMREAVATPACASLASLVWLEVTIAADAPPGRRELRLLTARGISNPLPFHVGQLPETTREAMISANLQVLGKEASALRKRPPENAEKRITLPCTLNGQIASGEINSYRFAARKGQRLVFATLARQLIPYVADAVPGWFQPVLVLHDAKGREVAYADDFRFKPDPVIFYQVPADGEYVLAIRDGIYRGREDFVYRISAGELPYLTGIHPSGGPAGTAKAPAMTGWGIDGARLSAPPADARPGLVSLTAERNGIRSNPVPFALDTLPEIPERESNNSPDAAQAVGLPVIINGRIDRPDDWDVFQFHGKAQDPVVIEVTARRLDSPLDSLVKLTDASGKVLAFNDDCEDLTAGTNTHHADSHLMTRLPADGIYLVHLGDTARHGGAEYSYRLRISAPRPDFELRVVPTSAGLPVKGGATVSVYAVRKDGFDGPVKVTLADPPPGFTASPMVIPPGQPMARYYFKAGAEPTPAPVGLRFSGSAMADGREVVHDAVPSEDKMQAFLWRHLVPAADFQVMVFDPKVEPKPKRTAPARPPLPAPQPPAANPAPAAPGSPAVATTPGAAPPKPKFSPQQIAGRLRQLKVLYEDGFLTDEFYDKKVAECEAGL
jgi:hypothetical protein